MSDSRYMDKRAHAREKLAYPVEIKFADKTFRVVTLNISAHGLGVLSDRQFPEGSCRIKLDDRLLDGKIVYRHGGGKGILDPAKKLYTYGIQLKQEIPNETVRLLQAKVKLNRTN